MKKERIHDREVYAYDTRPASVWELFEQTVHNHPSREAVVYEGKRITYEELMKQVKKISAYLRYECSLEKGDRLALLVGNRAEFIQMFLACTSLGIIVVPLNLRSSVQELINMMDQAEARVLFVEEGFDEVVKKWKEKHPESLVIGTKDVDKGLLYDQFESLLHHAFPEADYPNLQEEDPLYIMYTSGTTGLPKGAIGSHVNIIHSALHYKEVFQAKEPVRTLIAVPLFHVTGLIGQLFYMLLVGGTNVLMKRYQTGKFIELIEKEEITFLFNVPTIYIMMLSHHTFKPENMRSLDIAAFGGAPMSQETIESLMKALPFIRLHNAYGATETSSPATITPKIEGFSRIASIGQPVPAGEIKVVDEDGMEVQPGEVGELFIRGPMIVPGYWKNDEANLSSFVDGYWKSGDMAMVDEENFVYLMDRKKNIINRGGEKVFSAEVENVLYGHKDVLEAAIVGVPDEIFGEEVKAFIVPKEGSSPTEDDIQQFMKERVADYKVPKQVVFIDHLPRNPGGKILKQRLADVQNNHS
ncbi:AMP-dependent ligase [Halobacillus andaensis]|uniref:AMP-dependent ligase n=1 Tax=Halobacillus andaensis TaxID=1176239 RepID=A0A917EX56_HALAA|nr:class I adenylate-forming enzyme family protein [Halobacillus andaensis]MBP2005210.1 acyl-CoA synthetase (AMP-forming)/AMP-acid ligase II [Halobacillus andaensis]GGF29694.1 AMP-dependent ligase [Halobacillus andaensis]